MDNLAKHKAKQEAKFPPKPKKLKKKHKFKNVVGWQCTKKCLYDGRMFEPGDIYKGTIVYEDDIPKYFVPIVQPKKKHKKNKKADK